SEIPATHESEIQSNYVAIPDGTGARVLMLRDVAGWSLPCFQTGASLADRKFGFLKRAVKQQLAIDVTTLFRLYTAPEREDKKRRDIIYAMENHSPQWAPGEDMLWIDRGALAD